MSASQEPEHEPGVHGAHAQAAVFRQRPGLGHFLQNPGHLGGGEIGRKRNARAVADHVPDARFLQAPADAGGPGALPDNGRTYRLSGFGVPGHRGFPLVGYAHAGHVGGGYAGLIQRHGNDAEQVGEDFLRVMGYPALVIDQLTVGQVGPAQKTARGVEHESFGALGGLVDGDDVFHGRHSFSMARTVSAMPLASMP